MIRRPITPAGQARKLIDRLAACTDPRRINSRTAIDAFAEFVTEARRVSRRLPKET